MSNLSDKPSAQQMRSGTKGTLKSGYSQQHSNGFFVIGVLVTASYPVISPRISQSTRAGDWVASIVWISSGR
jgi:hypothetical protein